MSDIIINEKFISEKIEVRIKSKDGKRFISEIKESSISREIKVSVNSQSNKKVIFRKK